MLEKRTEKKRSFAIHTLGCKVNTYESDAIACALRNAGFAETDFSDAADVYIVNTCTVTNVADKKSRQMLHRARKKNAEALVVAVGCYVDAAMKNPEMQGVLRDASVDLWLSNRDKGDIVKKVIQALSVRENDNNQAAEADRRSETGEIFPECREQSASAQAQADAKRTEALPRSERKTGEPVFVTQLDGHTRAFVKVQDGCNQFCSYCIIPYVRGRIRSRAIDECTAEIRALAEGGVREVVLTGIHLSSYGKDWENKSGGLTNRESDDIENTADAPLLRLIHAVNEIEGIRRIRLGSLEPRLMTEEFVSALAANTKLCPHFHLSLQSGCAATLRRMNRHYTPQEYWKSCQRLRAHFSDPAITTDVIVGFPGETEDEFSESRKFAETVGFYEMHVFPYARRAGTRADRMEGHVSEAVKETRSHIMLALSERMSRAFRDAHLGRELTILCEEERELSGVRYATGFTPEYIRCVKRVERFERNAILTGTAVGYAEKNVLLLD